MSLWGCFLQGGFVRAVWLQVGRATGIPRLPSVQCNCCETENRKVQPQVATPCLFFLLEGGRSPVRAACDATPREAFGGLCPFINFQAIEVVWFQCSGSRAVVWL